MLVTSLNRAAFFPFELSHCSKDFLSLNEHCILLSFLARSGYSSSSVKSVGAATILGLGGLELECILSDDYELRNKACD